MYYIELDEIDSSNDYIKRNLEDLPNLSVVRCNYQTKGRGRNGHLWQSNKGDDLLMSILIKDFKDSQNLHKMTQIAACSVADLLHRYGIKAKIKWPNDIYVDNLKICGILVEAVYQGDLRGVVVGIGLNVNSINGDYASMKMKTGNSYLIETIMIRMLAQFKIYYGLYQQGCYREILNYVNKMSYLKERKIEYLDYGLVTFTKLNEDGTVEFIDSNNQKHNVLINEISLHK